MASILKQATADETGSRSGSQLHPRRHLLKMTNFLN